MLVYLGAPVPAWLGDVGFSAKSRLYEIALLCILLLVIAVVLFRKATRTLMDWAVRVLEEGGERTFGRVIERLNQSGRAMLLPLAAAHGNLRAVKQLVENGVDVDSVAAERGLDIGHSALYSAACKGHGEVVEFLIAEGADIELGTVNLRDHRDRDFRSPLEGALREGQQAIALRLIECGADVSGLNRVLDDLLKSCKWDLAKWIAFDSGVLAHALQLWNAGRPLTAANLYIGVAVRWVRRSGTWPDAIDAGCRRFLAAEDDTACNDAELIDEQSHIDGDLEGLPEEQAFALAVNLMKRASRMGGRESIKRPDFLYRAAVQLLNARQRSKQMPDAIFAGLMSLAELKEAQRDWPAALVRYGELLYVCNLPAGATYWRLDTGKGPYVFTAEVISELLRVTGVNEQRVVTLLRCCARVLGELGRNEERGRVASALDAM